MLTLSDHFLFSVLINPSWLWDNMRKSFHIAQQFDYSKKCQHLQETCAQFKCTLCPQFTSLVINSINILHSVVSQRILILAQSLVHGSYFSAPATGDYYKQYKFTEPFFIFSSIWLFKSLWTMSLLNYKPEYYFTWWRK